MREFLYCLSWLSCVFVLTGWMCSAWPIGVTMVGIHERSAREKLHEKGMAAHIMSDEVTRKFLQSIKRCLSFCQTRWIPEDPLQMMG